MEILRYCFPPSVRQTLDELPSTLDETYERVLNEIKKSTRVYALRLLQCLAVAIRPLRVEELAEVLAVDFGGEEGIPKLNPNWRWEDEEQALLASCSSLIVIVESDVKSDVVGFVGLDVPSYNPGIEFYPRIQSHPRIRSRIVQFSHFSVKEFLTSDRLATSTGDISRYHIDLQPAHTALAQACMSVLLQSDDGVEEGGVRNISPLARYAAEHWVVHAKDEKVSSCIRKAMEYLFDVDKPHFATWLKSYDIDTDTSSESAFRWFTSPLNSKSRAAPLYYAARCGFQDLVEHLVAGDPKRVNSMGGYYFTPLVAALAAGHFQTANFLYDNGANPNVKGHKERTPLHSAAYCGEFKIVQVLLKYKADVHARDVVGMTPLNLAPRGLYRREVPNSATSFSNVARLLLEHGEDVNAQANDHSTALHSAARSARYGRVEAMRVLLEHGADVNVRKKDSTTPLHEAACRGAEDVVRVLLEHGADINARKNDDTTPLHEAAHDGTVSAIRVLLEHGANINVRKKDSTTPLHEAARRGAEDAIHVLLEHGADINARKNDGTTPLHEAAHDWKVGAIRVLLKHGADINARKNDGTALLHLVKRVENFDVIHMLLKLGADVNARKNDDTTPLHEAARIGNVWAMHLLIRHGADVNARKNDDTTTLHEATHSRIVGAISMLVKLVDVNARKKDNTTPLHEAAQHGTVEGLRVLLKYGANVAAEDSSGNTALQVARDNLIKRFLSEYGAK